MVWEQLAELFSGMDLASAVCLGLGLILVTVEIFQPGMKVFGIIGGICLCIGMALRISNVREGYSPMAMFFLLTLIIVIFIFAAFFTMICTVRRGWIMRIPTRKDDSVKDSEQEKLTELMGKSGTALDKLCPNGIAEIDGKQYEVVAEGFFINDNEKITVVAVEGNRIVVKRLR
ncbi:MAG: NfeD family protein [Christensenellales bacterium]